MVRFALPEDLAALDELLLQGDAWPTTRPVMTLALVLARTPSAGRLEAAFEKAIDAVPRMRQRVAHSVWTLGRASWVDVDDFDLSYHLRRIGAPGDGDLDSALEWASGGATSPFDPGRPLWDAVLVERLVGGRALMVIQAHHVIADGVRAVQMMAALLDLKASPPDASVLDGVDGHPTVLSPNAAQFVRAVGRAWVTNPAQAADLARSMSRASLRPAHALADTTSYVRSALRTVDRGRATPSPLLSSRSNSRRFATLEMPLDGIKATAKAREVTVNDVYLTGLIGGMRRYPPGIRPHAVRHCRGPSHRRDRRRPTPSRQPHQWSDHPWTRISRRRGHTTPPRPRPGGLAPRRTRTGCVGPSRPHPSPGARARRHSGHGSTRSSRPGQQPGRSAVPAPSRWPEGRSQVRLRPLPQVPAMTVSVSHDGVCTIGFTLDPAAITDTDLFVGSVQDAFGQLLSEDTSGGPAQLDHPSQTSTPHPPPEGES